MKSTDKKLDFIRLRAEGRSYSYIAAELGISKSTCTKWEKELAAEISTLKAEMLGELYTAYGMDKEARIKTLGEVINRIDTALDDKDLSELPADRLLDLKLKYTRELKGEYVEPVEPVEDDIDGILQQLNTLYNESKGGAYTPAQLKAQLSILEAKKKAIATKEAGLDIFQLWDHCSQ